VLPAPIAMNGACPIVVIVSGDRHVRDEVKALLSMHDIPSVEHDSAADYLACAAHEVPSCLIIDVDLPDICGLDLQQQLASTGTAPPIVFVTRCALIAHSVRAMRTGALDFLTLPVDPGHLLSVVQSAHALGEATRARRDSVQRLTVREREVFQKVVSGRLNKQIAADLCISEITVQIHRRRVMRKMCAGSFAELVRIAASLSVPIEGRW